MDQRDAVALDGAQDILWGELIEDDHGAAAAQDGIDHDGPGDMRHGQYHAPDIPAIHQGSVSHGPGKLIEMGRCQFHDLGLACGARGVQVECCAFGRCRLHGRWYGRCAEKAKLTAGDGNGDMGGLQGGEMRVVGGGEDHLDLGACQDIAQLRQPHAMVDGRGNGAFAQDRAIQVGKLDAIGQQQGNRITTPNAQALQLIPGALGAGKPGLKGDGLVVLDQGDLMGMRPGAFFQFLPYIHGAFSLH